MSPQEAPNPRCPTSPQMTPCAPVTGSKVSGQALPRNEWPVIHRGVQACWNDPGLSLLPWPFQEDLTPG
jgi:hypothetical protein